MAPPVAADASGKTFDPQSIASPDIVIAYCRWKATRKVNRGGREMGNGDRGHLASCSSLPSFLVSFLVSPFNKNLSLICFLLFSLIHLSWISNYCRLSLQMLIPQVRLWFLCLRFGGVWVSRTRGFLKQNCCGRFHCCFHPHFCIYLFQISRIQQLRDTMPSLEQVTQIVIRQTSSTDAPIAAPACSAGNGYDGRIVLRISAIFVILFGSSIGQ